VKQRLAIIFASFAIGGLVLAGKSWSQQKDVADNEFRPRSSATYDNSQGPAGALGRRRGMADFEFAKPANKIERLLILLRNADEAKPSRPAEFLLQLNGSNKAGPPPSKAELTKQLEAAVTEGFDEDMKVRENELSKLQEQLSKLRAQLDRRQKAKSEIIQLEVKVLLNEAAGLGFSNGPGERGNRKFDFYIGETR
jgi:hypothetical protein